MEVEASGDGHVVVVSRVVVREPTGPVGLPLSVLFAEEEALASLAGIRFGRDLVPRIVDAGVPEDEDRRGSDVALSGSPDGTGRPVDRPSGLESDATDGRSAFVLGLHASSVGDGDPTSPTSLVGIRVLEPGSYRDVPVPIWQGNPFPVWPARHTDGRSRTHWTCVEFGATDGNAEVDLTATLWHDLAVDVDHHAGPIRDDAGHPVTSTETVAFGDCTDAIEREPNVAR